MSNSTEFKPVIVGDPYADGPTKHITWGRNAAIGAGAGAAAGLTTYLLSGLGNKGKARKKWKRALTAALVGSGVGLGAFGGMSGWQELRGTNYSHSYRDPEEIKKTFKDGETPDLQIAFSGAGDGTWQNKANDEALFSVDKRYGSGRTLLANPHDAKYVQDYVKRFLKVFPNARIRVQGHSHGGATAYDFAQWAARNNIPIDKLLTLDPIYRLKLREAKPGTTREWANYVPADANWKAMFDLWAILGGRGHKPRGAENHIISVPKWNNHNMIKEVPEGAELKYRAAHDYDANRNIADDPRNWWVPERLRKLIGS